jgi:hypothetical protein
MCLYIKRYQKFKTAKTDIKCYKILIKQTDVATAQSTVYKTFYREIPVSMGETYTSEFSRESHMDHFKFSLIEKRLYSFKSIEKGLHSFKSTEELLNSLGECCLGFPEYWDNKAVAECFIPAGSKYYEGLFNHCESYASDTLTYVKIL